MIRGFKHKELKEVFERSSAKIDIRFQRKAIRILDTMESATRPEDMDFPGFDFHSLRGKPKRYSCHVNGNWCITFEWQDGPGRVNFEDYH